MPDTADRSLPHADVLHTLATLQATCQTSEPNQPGLPEPIPAIGVRFTPAPLRIGRHRPQEATKPDRTLARGQLVWRHTWPLKGHPGPQMPSARGRSDYALAPGRSDLCFSRGAVTIVLIYRRAPVIRAVFGSQTVVRVHQRAFTLVEVLLSIGIIGLLLAIALPGLARTMATARSFRCQVAQRSVAFDFNVFASDDMGPDRGDDADLKNRFRLETFQESQYGIDEFWRYGAASTHDLPDDQNNDPMRCAEVPDAIRLRRDRPCSSGGVTPPSSISFGFNLRLHRQTVGDGADARSEPVVLSASVLERGNVPLFWDVNGRVAAARGVNPVFTAPALSDVSGPLADGSSWFPGYRHNGAANFAFIDGHVESSSKPLTEPGWIWAPPLAR
jgi:prepilin-type processing-associated H-X9-DG protein/prepilin-type N-terminal cleavage/methylation domain-containing protein